jgi:hypothetical protein
MKFESQPLTPYRSARHFFGAEMRRQRVAASMSLVQLATAVVSSKSTLARVETAELMPPPGLAGALDVTFEMDGLFGRLYDLARREAHPDQYRRYMDFEARAETVEHYAGQIVPGLLQTEDYVRAYFQYDDDATEDEIEQRVAARIGRQERLRSDAPPYLWAVLDEAVLRRPVGGPGVMRKQLAALLPLVDRPRTKVQVLPFSHGGHALMGGSTTLLKLPDSRTAAYEEAWNSGRLYEDIEEVRKRQRLYDALRAYALPPRESAALIKQAMEGYEQCEPLST